MVLKTRAAKFLAKAIFVVCAVIIVKSTLWESGLKAAELQNKSALKIPKINQHARSGGKSDLVEDTKLFKTQKNFNNDTENTSAVREIPLQLRPALKGILQRDFESGIRCENGFFRVQGMEECRPWLTCDQIENPTLLTRGKKIGAGIGKLVYRGVLESKHNVALSVNRDKDWFKERVLQGYRNLVMLQPSPFALQVLGYCEETPNATLITESCETCKDLSAFMQTNEFSEMDEIRRFQLATKIVGSFDLLHHGLSFPRVHCDLHTPEEAFKQFVVSQDRNVFLEDVDELPPVDKKNGIYAKCIEESHGIMKVPQFIAPEQRYTQREFHKHTSQKPIDEKADVWKIPDLTEYLMGEKKEILKKLQSIHKQCKNLRPELRPTARDVLIEYLTVLRDN